MPDMVLAESIAPATLSRNGEASSLREVNREVPISQIVDSQRHLRVLDALERLVARSPSLFPTPTETVVFHLHCNMFERWRLQLIHRQEP